jgi:hypothetical protein
MVDHLPKATSKWHREPVRGGKQASARMFPCCITAKPYLVDEIISVSNFETRHLGPEHVPDTRRRSHPRTYAAASKFSTDCEYGQSAYDTSGQANSSGMEYRNTSCS